jgi:subtilisin family serine protease
MLEISEMKPLVRVTTLASAVAAALVGIGFSLSAQSAQPHLQAMNAAASNVAQSSVGRYIVTFEEAGLLHYGGSVSGLAATAPTALGSRKLDSQSAAARSYANYLGSQRAVHIASIEQALGRPLAIQHAYGINTNGISASMSVSEAAAVASLPGIKEVRPVRTYSLDTFRGPKFIGADKIWDGTAVPGGIATKGQGIKVGIIDTGTNTGHPELTNDAACGFSVSNPKLHAFDCNTSSAGVCNGPTPDAQVSGHGVHTQTTVAGNTIDNTANPSPILPDGVTMSGVAPCATVYSYRVESADGSLSGDAIEAAIESLAVDQIDVANYSIGVSCSNGTPWSDEDRMFLDSVNADVFVAASAGNTRASAVNPGDPICPDPVGGVSHMGPWLLTVAASTQDELFSPRFSVTGPGTVPANLQTIALVPGSNTLTTEVPAFNNFPLRDYPANLAGCTDTGAFPAHYFDGSIAVVRRGFNAPGTTACSFVEKVNNAATAGAQMVLIANNQATGVNPLTDGTTIPSFMVNDLATADALIAFVSANPGPTPDADIIFADGFDGASAAGGATADYVPGEISPVQPDVLGSFSEQGPTPVGYDDLTKPDITAPGVNIYAGGRADDGYYFLDSGTSMSSPHMAGSAALVRSAHPDWTVQEVKSALMTTATNANGTLADGTTPWTPDQVGSGRVDLTKAALAGLTLDETYARFVAADPATATVAMKDLNLPSMRNSSCSTSCTWTRTVKNRLGTSGSWSATAAATAFGLTVSPASFTLAPGATQVLTVVATPTGNLTAEAFGAVNLHETSGQSPDQHLTAAIKTGGAAPGGTCTNGNCVLAFDNYTGTGSLRAVGAGAGAYFVWLSRFTPDASAYPFTLTSVQTAFVGNLNGGGVGAAVGETFDIYVYQDDDNDPSNGATLLGSVKNNVVASPLGAIQSITLPGSGIALAGPGDVLIAMVYDGTVGGSPAAADNSGPDAQRSWIGDIVDAPPQDPVLTDQNMQLIGAVISGFTHNWIIRGQGVQPSGQVVELGASLNAKK